MGEPAGAQRASLQDEAERLAPTVAQAGGLHALATERHEAKCITELEWQRAVASLNPHTIYSPLSGVVVYRLLSPGELARQTPILKLAQIDPLRVEVFAPLSLLGKLKPGLKAEVRPDGGISTTYLAEITAANRVVDSVSGAFGVRLEMPNPHNAIPPGLPCTVKFHTAQ